MKLSANPAPFGTVLGITDCNVAVYSSDYDSADKTKYENRDAYVSYQDGEFTGYKYQCVELARRYWLVNFGVVFDSIPMAYNIFELKSARAVATDDLVPLQQFPNGYKSMPAKGSLLIWEAKGDTFKITGHVAVVVDVGPDHVDIVEQNVLDEVWKGTKYSRRLPATLDSVSGSYTISCTFAGSHILGWTTIVEQTQAANAAVPTRHCLSQRFVQITEEQASPWLDLSDPAVKVWAACHGERLAAQGESAASYFVMSHAGHAGLARATRELHAMFLRATDHVLANTDDRALVGPFGVPDGLWPLLRESWAARRGDTVCARFDLCLTDAGVKAYEYNADSASALMECGLIQDRWADGAGLSAVGRGAGAGVAEALTATWRAMGVEGPLHLLHDDGAEEEYHALYMRAAAERAGIATKVVRGLAGLRWAAGGEGVEDGDGVAVRNVWKTWSWTTAVAGLADAGGADAWLAGARRRDPARPPQLADVLLAGGARVFEPLWTLLPSSKAILPVLWRLFPGHPLLLRSESALTPELAAAGYAAKPTAGRGGANVVLHAAGGGLLQQTAGPWGGGGAVYQELCPLPRFGGRSVQACCFTTRGRYLATVLRTDEGAIVGMDSAVHCLRVADAEPPPDAAAPPDA